MERQIFLKRGKQALGERKGCLPTYLPTYIGKEDAG